MAFEISLDILEYFQFLWIFFISSFLIPAISIRYIIIISSMDLSPLKGYGYPTC